MVIQSCINFKVFIVLYVALVSRKSNTPSPIPWLLSYKSNTEIKTKRKLLGVLSKQKEQGGFAERDQGASTGNLSLQRRSMAV